MNNGCHRAPRVGWTRLVAGLVLLGCCALAWAQQDVLRQAAALLEQRQAQAAYQLLKPLEEKRAGEADYDLLLGIAANDTGRHTEAVFALERVVAVRPKDSRARAELARAHFAMGEMDTARREFGTVRSMPIPDEVRATIDRYLDAVEQIPGPGESQIRAYVELTGGYDSNANAATGAGQFGVPAFGGLPLVLDPLSRKQSAWFGAAGFGIGARIPATPRLAVIGSVAGNKRINQQDVNQFDTGSIDGSVGLQYTMGNHVFSGVWQGQSYFVDNETFRNAAGGTAQWQFNATPRDQISVFGQYAQLTYPGQGFRDVKRYVGGAGYAHGFANAAAVFTSAYFGNENEKDAAFPWIGNQLWGLRLGGSMPMFSNERLTLFANVRYERRNYGGTDPFFLVSRRDDQIDAGLGVTYNFAKYWTATPQYAYTNNDSNVPVSAYDRNLIQLTIRRMLAF